MGSTAPAWLSAANEVAVDAFLAGRLRWPQIADVCDATLQHHEVGADDTVADIVAADRRAREVAGRYVQRCEETAHPMMGTTA